MRNKLQKLSLVGSGIVIGVALSLNLPANADREATQPLPLDELRAFTEVSAKSKAITSNPFQIKNLLIQPSMACCRVSTLTPLIWMQMLSRICK
jgi:hypothetical protein